MKIPYVFKKCRKCEEWKVANEVNFGKCKSNKDSYQNWCKVCHKEYAQSEKGKVVNKKGCKKYRQSDKGKEARKKYRQTEKAKEYNKKYNQSGKGQVAAFNGRSRRRQREENQGRGITTEQWKEIMNFFGWRCAYSGELINKSGLHSIDHLVPVSKGGLNEIWNMVPMLKSYNSSKRDKDMIEWYTEQDFYDEERLNKIKEWQEYAYNKYGLNDEII